MLGVGTLVSTEGGITVGVVGVLAKGGNPLIVGVATVGVLDTFVGIIVSARVGTPAADIVTY